MDQDAPKEDSVYKRIGYPYNRRFLGRGLVSEVDKERWRKNRALLNHLFHRKYILCVKSQKEAFINLCPQSQSQQSGKVYRRV